MRTQLITVFFLTFVSFIAVLVWRVDEVMFADKMAWGEAQARSQMAPLVHSIEIEFSGLADSIALVGQQLKEGGAEEKKDYPKSSPLGRFEMVSSLGFNGEWSFEKSLFLDKGAVKNWAVQYITLLLKNIDAREIQPGQFMVYSLLDPQRKTYLFVLHHQNPNEGAANGKNWVGFLLGAEFFQSLMDRQKGQISSVFLVNNLGQALGHTTPEYVGNLLSEDPIVAELMKSQNGNGSGTFRDLKGEAVQGIYEQVAKSNVYAVITTPTSALLKNRDQVRLQFLLMGLGLGLVGIAIFALVYKNEKTPLPLAAANKGAAAAPVFVATPKAVAPTPAATVSPAVPSSLTPAPAAASVAAPQAPVLAQEDLQREKMQAFLRVASALSHELKGPMSSILGHAQLLKSESGASEHINEIETQARKTRELIQKLQTFSGEASLHVEKVHFADVINKAIRNVEAKLFRKGVNVVKDFKAVADLEIPAELVVKAIENILNNSIESMERSLKKDLKLSLVEKGNLLELTISDTGEGIESQNLPHVFEPFFTTRSSQNQVGLGLSMALGIIRELKGTLAIESERGKGTTVRLTLDPKATAKASTESLDVMIQNTKSLAAKPASVMVAPPLPTAKKESAALPILEDKEAEAVLRIENIADEMTITNIELRKLDKDQAQKLPPVPTEEVLPELAGSVPKAPVVAPPPVVKTGKIDKPKIDLKRKSSVLEAGQFQIRKPGEKI